MYRSISLEEDIALKETVANRFADKSAAYAWREILNTAQRAPVPEITVTRSGEEETFSLAQLQPGRNYSIAVRAVSNGMESRQRRLFQATSE